MDVAGDMVSAETLGDFCREQRHRLELSQSELAERVGVTQSSISAAENNETQRFAALRLRMLDAMGVDVQGMYYLCAAT